MAKTYTAAGTVAAGDVATAAAWNVIGSDVNNLIVPPTFMVYRSTNQTGYTAGSAITWNATGWDSDGMVSGSTVTVRTAGIYQLSFNGVIDATATLTDVVPTITVNGSDLFDEHKEPFSGTLMSWTVSTVANLAVNDVLTATIGTTGGSAYIIRGALSVSTSQTRLSGVWIGKTA